MHPCIKGQATMAPWKRQDRASIGPCMHWHYLSRFVAELDGASSAAPGRDGAGRGSVNVGEVGRPQSGGRDEREGDAPEPAVAFAGRDQHGRPTEDATDGARVAALEQPLLVLQHEVVELRVARHHSRRAEQVRLEHRPIPAWSTTDGGTITCIHGTHPVQRFHKPSCRPVTSPGKTRNTVENRLTSVGL
jgi:hypothetical protein